MSWITSIKCQISALDVSNKNVILDFSKKKQQQIFCILIVDTSECISFVKNIFKLIFMKPKMGSNGIMTKLN